MSEARASALKKNGLTLVEALMALGLAAVTGVLLTVIIVNSTGLYYKESSKLQEGLNVNDTLAKVRSYVKESSAVAISFSSGGTTYASGINQLVLKVPSFDSSNNIISTTYDYYIFFLDAGKLRFRIFPDALSSRKPQDQILTTLVDTLVFKYLDASVPPVEVPIASAEKVLITLSLEQKAGAEYEIITVSSEAYLRND